MELIQGSWISRAVRMVGRCPQLILSRIWFFQYSIGRLSFTDRASVDNRKAPTTEVLCTGMIGRQRQEVDWYVLSVLEDSRLIRCEPF